MRACSWKSKNNKLYGVAVACCLDGIDFVLSAPTIADVEKIFASIYDGSRPRRNKMRPVTISRTKPGEV
jgi:hypothetical protein